MGIEKYQQQIEKTGVFFTQYSIGNIDEAKSLLNKLTQIQRELRQIKSSISLEMKQVKLEYQNKIKTNTTSIFSIGALVLGNKKLSNQFKADKKRDLTNEKHNALVPYENLKLNIDSYIVSLEEKKNIVKDYIASLK